MWAIAINPVAGHGKGAIRAALKEYKDSETLNPRIDSFHIATEEGLKSAMSLFY